ncbi:MAG: sulfurtransferase [bacterium]
MGDRTFGTLITAEQLLERVIEPAALLDWVIIDCRFSLANPEQGYSEYKQGHIPGAFYAHLDNDLSGTLTETSGRHPLPFESTWLAQLATWGINPQSQVVVYDHGSGAIAARLWWMLRWSGHSQVALLDGGFKAWQENKLPVSIDKPSITDLVHQAEFTFDHGLWVSTTQLEVALPEITLIDARSADRFNGISEPIDPVAGHIPGAISMPLEDNIDQGEEFLPADRLRERFAKLALVEAGETKRSEIVHMCGSGVTACHNILAMEVAGLSGSRLYVGSWSEWIRDPHRAVARAAAD